MYLPPANFQQFTINDYDSVTVLVMTFFTVGFQPEGPLFNRPMRFCFHHLELIVDSKKIKASSVFSLLASRPTRTTNKQKLC